MIEAAAQVFCKPEVDYEPRIWEYGTRRVLEVWIAPSPRAPHTAPDENGRPTVYMRKADENKVASAVERRYLELKFAPDPVALVVSKPQQRILDYFAANNLPFEPGYNYNIHRIAANCLLSEKECVDAVSRLILLNETV